MGSHIDGFIAVVAHTHVARASSDKVITGRKADAILAAHYASEAALRLLKPGQEVCLEHLFGNNLSLVKKCRFHVFLKK